MKPIIISGLNRTGTTWLCNIVSSKFNVAGLSHPLHYGSLELNPYLMNKATSKNFSSNRFADFFSEYSESDPFLVTHLSKSIFNDSSFKNFYEFVICMMDEYAKSIDKKYWLIKVDPYLILDTKEWNRFESIMNRKYGSFYHISIKREFNSFMDSSLKHIHNKGRRNFLQKLKLEVLYKMFYGKSGLNNCLKINYEELKNNHNKTLIKISKYLGLDISRQLEKEYIKNSSFQNDKRPIQQTHKYYLGNLAFPIGRFIFWLISQKKAKPIYWKRIARLHNNPKEVFAELVKEGQIELAKEIIKIENK